ncbi:MAG: cell division protein FtsZ [Armatimonadetes bacterium]|nr:cell division protein FtsZ [Candidatus Hippobium faecium]
MTQTLKDSLDNGKYTKIKVIGVGGGGMNAVHQMIKEGVAGVEFLVVNTDQHILDLSPCENKLAIGENLTRGLGAGGNPEIGRQAAEESKNEICEQLQGCDMVFITAGMGGGTGTGAAPVIAKLSTEMEILTIGVVTKPFTWEGPVKKRRADEGIKNLTGSVDTLITIPNDKLREVCDKKITFQNALKISDDVLRQGVSGISDIIVVPGMINVDFADVQNIMKNKGSALMGIGIESGEDRAIRAAERACESRLLERSIDGATGMLVNITANQDVSLQEINDAMEIIYNKTNIDTVEVIFGVVYDDSLEDQIKITVVATGFNPPTARKIPGAPSINTQRPASSRTAVPSSSRTSSPARSEYSEQKEQKTSFSSGPSFSPKFNIPDFLNKDK